MKAGKWLLMLINSLVGTNQSPSKSTKTELKCALTSVAQCHDSGNYLPAQKTVPLAFNMRGQGSVAVG